MQNKDMSNKLMLEPPFPLIPDTHMFPSLLYTPSSPWPDLSRGLGNSLPLPSASSPESDFGAATPLLCPRWAFASLFPWALYLSMPGTKTKRRGRGNSTCTRTVCQKSGEGGGAARILCLALPSGIARKCSTGWLHPPFKHTQSCTGYPMGTHKSGQTSWSSG